MSENVSKNVWDFAAHPEWQDDFDKNGTYASLEQYQPGPSIIVDTDTLALNALRFKESVTGQHDLPASA